MKNVSNDRVHSVRVKLHRAAAGGISLLLAASAISPTSLQVFAQDGPVQVASPLLITELVPNTENVDGNDAYEYCELYNTSNAPLSMDQYVLRYDNGSAVNEWTLPAGTTIPANGVLIVRAHNDVTDAITEEQFRETVGLSADVPVAYVNEVTGGFANSGERSFAIDVKATGQRIASVTYNGNGNGGSVGEDVAITFGYTAGSVEQPVVSYEGTMTPGVVDAEMTYTVPTGGTASISGGVSVTEGSPYTFTVNVENMGVVVTANALMNGKSYPLEYVDGTFACEIPAADFADLSTFDVSAILSDGVNTVQTNPLTVTVNAGDPSPVEIELSSPLQITEVVPNTANEGTGSDVYEYFELYNSSTMNVSLDNYHFLYDNGSSVTEWKLNETGSVLEAGKTALVWIRNDGVISNNYTTDQFRAEYGIGEDVMVLSVNSGGFSNSGTRRMNLATATNETLYTVEYTAGNSSDGSIGEGESIAFVYDGDVISATYDGTVTPGCVAEGSVAGNYTIPSVVAEPAVGVNAPAEITEESPWTVTIADNNLSGKILSAVMTITAGETTLTKEMTVVDGVITGTVDYNEVRDVEQFFYNIAVTDGVNTATAGGSVAVGTAAQVDASKAPALVITEIMPDTSNVGGSDGYEFIELYNNSNRDIDLKDYKLYYNYPDNGDDSDVIWWETNGSKVLKAGDTLVFWVKNGPNDAMTLDDFNAQFGTSIDSGHLIEISSAGMANGSARGLKIASNVKDVIDYVTYNMNGADNTSSSASIRYQNTYQNGGFVTGLVSDDGTPNPGTVEDSEKPAYQAVLPESVSAPVLTDRTEGSFNNALETFDFTVEAVSNESTIKTVRLYLKDNNTADYEVFNLLRTGCDTFTRELAGIDLLNKRSYTYYFEVSDGYNTVMTQEKTILNTDVPAEGDRVNVPDGQYAKGDLTLIGTGDNLVVDGTDYTSVATKSVFEDATIAFDASQTDVFFKNAVACGDDVIGVFNEGTYATWRTYAYPVDEKYINSETGEITLAFHAGNKANNLEHNVENNDDFVLKNIRLVLPDGVTLRPVSYKGITGIGAVEHTTDNWKPDFENAVEIGGITSETEINMGDGISKTEILYVTFQAEKTSLDALRYVLDTTTMSDGEHTVTSGQATAKFIVDNTAPVITSAIEEGAAYFEYPVDVTVTDAVAAEGVNQETYLDGELITLPYTVSYEQDGAGAHTLTVRAIDPAGNVAEETWNFSINEKDAEVNGMEPGDGSVVHEDPTLSVTATDPNRLDMNVRFLAGERLTLEDGITASNGVSNTSGTVNPVAGAAEGDGFPYEVFEITVPDNIGNETSIEAVWSGTANNAKTKMYVYNTVTAAYEEVETEQGIDGEQMTLTSDIDLANHVTDGKVSVMVQNGEGYTPAQYAPGEKGENATYNENDTPREQYDFTFAVESDTQYYNEDYDGNPDQDVDGVYQYQLDIHNWIINNRERMNIQYMFHDGDIIDDEPLIPEWENADAAYKMLDEAGMPYGVLAGNHDVGHLSGDYTNFSKYFGASRYENNPWYGESYKDNRGHYDLITVDGIDFIMIYMGWGVGDEEIAWMNDVLAQYPERKASLNFHEDLLASGGMGDEPQRIHDEVVVPNPNVVMVLSGHYHNAQTVTEAFDDNGDGVTDRTVYQMLFDYQGFAQGGMGYMRLMHFDHDNEQITIRTYSPSLDDYDAKDQTGIGDVAGINGEEEFVIPYADLGITRSTKTLTTNSFMVNVYGDKEIGSVSGVKSGDTASITMENAANGTYGWYAEVTNANGGLTRSEISYVTVDKEEAAPVITLPSVEKNRVALHSAFNPMEGVSAMDYTGKDITDKVSVTAVLSGARARARAGLDPSSITSAVGTYTLTYTVTDDYGNTSSAIRTVTVYAPETPVQPGGDQTTDGGNTTGGQTSTTDQKNDVETGIYDNPAGSLVTAVAALGIAAIILKKKEEEDN